MSDARAMWDAAAEGMAPEARQALQLKGVQTLLAWVKSRSPIQECPKVAGGDRRCVARSGTPPYRRQAVAVVLHV